MIVPCGASLGWNNGSCRTGHLCSSCAEYVPKDARDLLRIERRERKRDRREIARLREELAAMTEDRDRCLKAYRDSEKFISKLQGDLRYSQQREREALAVVEGIANMTHAKMRDSQDVPMNGADYNLMFREWAQSIARHLLSRAREQSQEGRFVPTPQMEEQARVHQQRYESSVKQLESMLSRAREQEQSTDKLTEQEIARDFREIEDEFTGMLHDAREQEVKP